MFRHDDGTFENIQRTNMDHMDRFFPTKCNFFWDDDVPFGSCGEYRHSSCGEFGIVTFSISNFHFLFLQHQHWNYKEVAVSGDLSDDDLNRANATQDPFNVIRIFLFHCSHIIILQQNFLLTWTLAPFSSHGELPNVLSLDWNNDSVFFSEVILSQLIPGGSGFGTFDLTATAPSLDISSQDLIAAAPTKVGVQTGSILRWVPV